MSLLAVPPFEHALYASRIAAARHALDEVRERIAAAEAAEKENARPVVTRLFRIQAELADAAERKRRREADSVALAEAEKTLAFAESCLHRDLDNYLVRTNDEYRLYHTAHHLYWEIASEFRRYAELMTSVRDLSDAAKSALRAAAKDAGPDLPDAVKDALNRWYDACADAVVTESGLRSKITRYRTMVGESAFAQVVLPDVPPLVFSVRRGPLPAADKRDLLEGQRAELDTFLSGVVEWLARLSASECDLDEALRSCRQGVHDDALGAMGAPD